MLGGPMRAGPMLAATVLGGSLLAPAVLTPSLLACAVLACGWLAGAVLGRPMLADALPRMACRAGRRRVPARIAGRVGWGCGAGQHADRDAYDGGQGDGGDAHGQPRTLARQTVGLPEPGTKGDVENGQGRREADKQKLNLVSGAGAHCGYPGSGRPVARPPQLRQAAWT
jgi:hypothetical protein